MSVQSRKINKERLKETEKERMFGRKINKQVTKQKRMEEK
jgi:hypothetical protein